ncbi:MAG TPA: GNAT family N-acetyltransferase [Gaiellaceae bacterium]|nr:GNAT family N-acetyltransferase [Gaiellaceae bacterium]
MRTLDLQPVLRGELVVLRPVRDDDFEALHAVASDPEIWAQHPHRDRHERAVFRDFFDGALASGGAFVVHDAKDGRVIGSTRFHGYDPVRGEVEIGWTFLARSHWGGRWNGAMKALLLDHAFAAVERVVFLIGEHNVRSRRAIERIGAVCVTEHPEPSDPLHVVYEMTSARWRSRSPR